MSSCERTSTRTQETVKVEATLSAPVSLLLARRQYRARTPTVRHWRTQLRKGLCYSGPTTLNWFPGGAWSTRASGRDWPDKHTELVCGRRRWLRVSASEASTCRLHELNCRQTALIDQLLLQFKLFHQQTYVIQTIRRVDRKHSVRFFWRKFSSRDTSTVTNHLEQHFEFSSSISTCLFIIFLMIAMKLL